MEKEYSEKEIRRLLERFMSGETTIEEEDRLGDYFRTAHDIPAGWQEYRLMFGYFDSGMDVTAAAEAAGYETVAAEAVADESTECESIAAKAPLSGPKLLIVRRYAAVAAAILFLVGMAVVMTYDNGSGQTSRRDVNRPALVAEQKSGQKSRQQNGQKTERDAEHDEEQKAELTKEQMVAQDGSQTVHRTAAVKRDSPNPVSSERVSCPAPMKKTAERDSQDEYEEIEREIINQYVIAEYNARREEGQCCILVENVDGYYELEDCASDVILM